MFDVEWDAKPGRLRISFADHVDRKQAELGYARLLELLKAAAHGFILVSDLSCLKTMDLDCEPFIDQAMDACNRAGVQKVIRVVPEPDKDIGFGIMSLFHYGRNVKIVSCHSLAEAEALLDQQDP